MGTRSLHRQAHGFAGSGAALSGAAEDPDPVESLALLTSAEMRAWDAAAIDGSGIPERLLMECAARAAARIVDELYPRGRVGAAVGRGNNGGDALVMLRCLRSWGRDVVAVPQESGAIRSSLLHGWEVPTATPDEAPTVFAGCDVIVDGLLGTGASGAPRDAVLTLIRSMAAAGRPIVSLDGPSGVDLTSGAVEGEAVSAEVTITFGAPKRGHLLHPGRVHTGRLLVVEVGFPPLGRGDAAAGLITTAWARAHLPEVPWNAHKGTVGTVIVVAGRSGMGGAAIMTGMGALRTGAGVVRIVSPEDNRSAIMGSIAEALFLAREGEEWREPIEAAEAVVLGPGMGTDRSARECLEHALRCATGSLILDADAITLVAMEPDLLAVASASRVLMTPHPLELGRLMEMETGDVVRDPFDAAARAAERFGCAVLLKGAPSMVASPGHRTLVSVTGHSGVATGGMGDTLAGAAGAFGAAGAPPVSAGALALHFCGRAAEIAGLGRGLLPRDVAESLPRALTETVYLARLRTAGVLLDLPAPR